MMLIGVDYHPSFQTIAFLMEETGECDERQLNHSAGEAERFYRDLQQRGIRVRVGMEATGYSRWFERLLAELGFEVWIGDPAEIKAKRVKKQKFDREDARLLLRLMRENNFPQIWVPGPENRDLRQLLWHRHRLVQMRTRIMNQLQALAMNEGYRWKKKLFSEQGRAQLEKLALAPWASRRRQELLELLDRLNPTIEELTAAVEREARKRPEELRLMTHPGVGPLTALAYVLIIGTPTRFQRGKQIGTYVGMIPSEDSSGSKQRLGHISKQGNSLLRFLLVEAAQAAARIHPEWRRRYIRLAVRRHKSIAKVAMGWRLGVHLYWMWRNGCEYSPSRMKPSTGDVQAVTWNFNTQAEVPVTSWGEYHPYISDWSPDAQWLLASIVDPVTNHSGLHKLRSTGVRSKEDTVQLFPGNSDYDLWHGHFSPDGHRIVFQGIRIVSTGFEASIFVAPASGGPWTRITDGKHWDDKPRWSPNGKLIYFSSERSGFFNVFSIHFDSASGKPVGDVTRVSHFQNSKMMIGKSIPFVGLSVSQSQLMATVSQSSGSIWILDNVDR